MYTAINGYTPQENRFRTVADCFLQPVGRALPAAGLVPCSYIAWPSRRASGSGAFPGSSAFRAPVGGTPTKTEEKAPTQEPTSAGEMPVDEDDWHVLGSPDAPVTIVEYSDFQ